MKNHLVLTFSIAVLFCSFIRAEIPITAAVLDFQTSGEQLVHKGSEVAVLLNAQLSSSPNLILVERQELEKLFSEQELSLSGTVTPESAAKVGALTGAKVLIAGRLFEAGDKFFLVGKIMSTETSRVFGEAITFQDLATLDKAVSELAAKIQTVVDKSAGALVAKVEGLDERIARMKKLTEGKKLPSISVNIIEQHLDRPAIDPAVQTELRSILQQLGFEVIDSQSSQKQVDVMISGEAFSELAARRGNLISCRSRVEIKAVRSTTGELLISDRQTGVGVDLAENVAGKSALENAVLKLVEGLVSKLLVN